MSSTLLRIRDDDDDDSNVSDWPLYAFGYHPNKNAAIAAFGLTMLNTIIVLFRLIKRRNKWGLCLPIGLLCYGFGFFARWESARIVKSEALLTVSQVLIIVSPAAFLAFNYILYGRIVRYAIGDKKGYSLIRPSRVSTLFVTSDILTFIVQLIGSGMMDSTGSAAKTGKTVLMAGLAFQLGSYIVYCGLVLYTHIQIRKDGTIGPDGRFPWIVFYTVYWSSIFIIIRGCYRTAEMAGGENGTLYTHEAYFYSLDTIPLFLATVVYAIFWSGRWLSSLEHDLMAQKPPMLKSVQGY